MSKVYVFLEKTTLSDGETTSTASVLELSPYSRTFSKDIVIKKNGIYKLSVFGIDSATPAEESGYVSAATSLVTRLDDFFNDGYSTSVNTSGVHYGTTLERLQYFLDNQYQFTGTGGPVNGLVYEATPTNLWSITNQSGTVTDEALVSWPKKFVYKYEPNYNSSSDVYEFHIWTQDEFFKTTYPLAQYTVVPPIDPIDNLLTDFTASKNTVIARSLSQQIDNAQAFLVGTVVTGFEVITLRILNPDNHAEYYDCPFFLGYNGNVGVNYQSMLTSIIEYISSITSLDMEDDWQICIPQLINNGTYFFVPFWDRVAVANANPSYKPVLYGGMGGYKDITDFDGLFTNMYTTTAFRDVVNFINTNYKSISALVVPDTANNSNQPADFKDAVTDYITAAPLSGDLSLISVSTQNLINNLNSVLLTAENFIASPQSPVPPGQLLEVINGRRYISMNDATAGAKISVLTYESYMLFVASLG